MENIAGSNDKKVRIKFYFVLVFLLSVSYVVFMGARKHLLSTLSVELLAIIAKHSDILLLFGVILLLSTYIALIVLAKITDLNDAGTIVANSLLLANIYFIFR